MRITHRLFSIAVACLSTCIAHSTAKAITPELVYLGGYTVVPGDTDTFGNAIISTASINNAGQVGALGLWFDNASRSGLFKWENGVLSDLLRTTDVANAPGFGAPPNSLGFANISDTGNVVGDIQVLGVDGIVSGQSRATMDTIAQSNFNIAPPTNAGYSSMDASAYSGTRVATVGTVNNNRGIWTGTDANAPSASLLLENTTFVPGTAFLIEEVSFGGPGTGPAINNDGLIASRVVYDGDKRAIVAGNPGQTGLFTIARTGGQAPGVSNATFVGIMSRPTMNHNGNMAFSSFVDLGGGNSEDGLFRTLNNVLTTVAVETITEVPGTGGSTISQIFGAQEALAGDDKYYFRASWDNSTTSGLLVHEPGQGLSVLHERGDIAPGTGSTFRAFAEVHANANGDYAFLATLEDDRQALFATNNGGVDLGLLLIEGETIDATGNNEFAEVTQMFLGRSSGGEDGRGRWFNDNGELLIEIEFAPSRDLPQVTSGLYVISVPEPSTIVLLLLVLGSVAATRRRRAGQ